MITRSESRIEIDLTSLSCPRVTVLAQRWSKSRLRLDGVRRPEEAGAGGNAAYEG
jgi:hypothetical protein